MGAKEWDSCTQVHISDDRDLQVASNSIVDCLIVPPGMTTFKC